MNTDAHHSGKAHSTNFFTRHSKVTHTVTASETQHGYTQSHRHKNTIRYKNLLNNGEHNTNTDTGG